MVASVSWDAIGAIAELLGASAVLVTLLYLSWQVRNSREELQFSIRQNRSAIVRDFVMELARDDDLRRILTKARTANGDEFPDGVKILIEVCELSHDDAAKLNSYFLAQWLYRVTTLNNIDDLASSERASFEQQLHRNYTWGIESVWFNTLRESFGDRVDDLPIFAYVNKLIAERGAAT
jgi:hypothetical protein